MLSRVAEIAQRCELLVALGGDNSITYSVMRGLFGDSLAEVGLVTIDAHHDLRDGETNGSPVRRLVDAGLPGANVVQLGIADFSNSPAYAARAAELGITVIPRDELRRRPLGQLVAYALERAGAGGRPVYVDLDVDVCDRAVVPGCPAAAPGGISADELRQIAFLGARDPRVRAIDITEIDATSDAHQRLHRSARRAARAGGRRRPGVADRRSASARLRGAPKPPRASSAAGAACEVASFYGFRCFRYSKTSVVYARSRTIGRPGSSFSIVSRLSFSVCQNEPYCSVCS